MFLEEFPKARLRALAGGGDEGGEESCREEQAVSFAACRLGEFHKAHNTIDGDAIPARRAISRARSFDDGKTAWADAAVPTPISIIGYASVNYGG